MYPEEAICHHFHTAPLDVLHEWLAGTRPVTDDTASLPRLVFYFLLFSLFSFLSVILRSSVSLNLGLGELGFARTPLHRVGNRWPQQATCSLMHTERCRAASREQWSNAHGDFRSLVFSM